MSGFCVTVNGRCRRCSGDGWYREYDGVGGAWNERCWACGAKGIVEVTVDLDALPKEVKDAWVASWRSPASPSPDQVLPQAPKPAILVPSDEDEAVKRFALMEMK